MQEIITGLGVQYLTNRAKLACAKLIFMQHFTFCTWMIHLISIEYNYVRI